LKIFFFEVFFGYFEQCGLNDFNMINEFDRVVLTENIESLGLVKDDVGVIVMIHKGGLAYEVEFLTLTGESIGIETLLQHQVRAIKNREILHVRKLEEAA
jgi:hypothetical protein